MQPGCPVHGSDPLGWGAGTGAGVMGIGVGGLVGDGVVGPGAGAGVLDGPDGPPELNGKSSTRVPSTP